MPGILCEHCSAMCCRYVALPIETPEERSDFDDIRWYLLHENISIFVEDGEWYISFVTDCRHLLPDHRCGIYETRPGICRRYDTVNCDYHSGEYGWEQHFMCPEHLDEYVQKRFAEGSVKERKPRSRKETKTKRRTLPRATPRRPADKLLPKTDLNGALLPILGIQR